MFLRIMASYIGNIGGVEQQMEENNQDIPDILD